MDKIRNIRWINQTKACKTPMPGKRDLPYAIADREIVAQVPTHQPEDIDMTTLDRSATVPSCGSFAVRAAAAVANAWRAACNRREIYRLGEMTDTELADIGLRRGDLHVVIKLPLRVDPTARLGSLAQARTGREMEI